MTFAKTYEEARAKHKPMARTAMKKRGRLTNKPKKRLRLKRKKDRDIEWSRRVKERDGWECQWPGGCTTDDKRIDAHHMAERSQRPDLKYVVSNGISLCRTHHDWIPLHRQEAIAMGLLSEETYEAARKR